MVIAGVFHDNHCCQDQHLSPSQIHFMLWDRKSKFGTIKDETNFF